MIKNLKEKAKKLKRQTTTLYVAYLRKDVAWYKKLFILLILIYALSPIDLIPDFIPILGYLDDLIIVPLGIYLAVKMIPEDIWADCQKQVEEGVRIEKKYKIAGLVFICMIWAIIVYCIVKIFI